jgi:chromosome segregation ATPase
MSDATPPPRTHLPTTVEAWRLAAEAFERERDQAQTEVERLRGEVQERNVQIARIKGNRTVAEAEVERLRRELALRDDSLANRKVRELRVEVERLRDMLDDRVGEILRLREALVWYANWNGPLGDLARETLASRP